MASNFIQNAIKHPGALTAEVGGPPSKRMGQVAKLAAQGDRKAEFFQNVLHPLNQKAKKKRSPAQSLSSASKTRN